MSTAARKARKRRGEKFVRTPKVGTPLLERSWGQHDTPSRNAAKAILRRADVSGEVKKRDLAKIRKFAFGRRGDR